MFFVIWLLILICCLSGCSHNGDIHMQISEESAYIEFEDNLHETGLPSQQKDTGVIHKSDNSGDIQEAGPIWEEAITTESEGNGILSSLEDIDLHAVDGTKQNYVFLYGNEEFSAQYTAENWKIVDSYKISNTQDMILICQALLNIHPVHGRDMQSIRTAEDMTFEWLQHNLAYAILPEDSPWRQNAKDVDLNPADQGKSFQEMYEDRTGRKFRVGDFIG